MLPREPNPSERCCAATGPRANRREALPKVAAIVPKCVLDVVAIGPPVAPVAGGSPGQPPRFTAPAWPRRGVAVVHHLETPERVRLRASTTSTAVSRTGLERLAMPYGGVILASWVA